MSAVMSPPKICGFRVFEDLVPEVTAAFSNREITESRRGEFLDSLGLNPEKLFLVKQVHGENLVRITPQTVSTGNMMADGLMTNCPGAVIGVLTADCLPVFLCDPVKQAVGIVHSGWRGALHGIAPKMVSAFQQNFRSRAEDIRVAFGPCIGPASYEVGAEFEAMFPGFYHPRSEDKGFFDLAGYVRKSLADAGIKPEHIHESMRCTFKESESFYSYRRENQTRERILSVISLRGEKYEGK